MARLRLAVTGGFGAALVVLSIIGCTTGTAGGGGDGGPANGGGDFAIETEASSDGADEEGGSVALEPAQELYQAGDVVTFTAEPDPGYRFDHWEGDVEGNENPLEVTVDGDLHVEAVFVAEDGEDGADGPGGDGDGDTDDGDGTDDGVVEPSGGLVADHSAASAFEDIPSEYFDQAKSDFRIFYGHTSHGSQLITGMNMLDTGAGTLDIVEDDTVDLGSEGDLGWVDITHDNLGESGNGFNVVMWSWCGGVSGNTEEGIDAYLEAMSALEDEYPDVVFVYMTGHLDGGGPEGNLFVRNNQIRDYCREHDRVLFDFADIETYNPDGEYYPDGTDWCDWCADWCSMHASPMGDCVDGEGCAHAHCFNCYRKGQVFWWLMARLAGWSGD